MQLLMNENYCTYAIFDELQFLMNCNYWWIAIIECSIIDDLQLLTSEIIDELYFYREELKTCNANFSEENLLKCIPSEL